jgi:hypothetical protein
VFGMICWLIKHGVPFDTAHALDHSELLAYTVKFAQFDNGGKEFDFDTMKFIDRN